VVNSPAQRCTAIHQRTRPSEYLPRTTGNHDNKQTSLKCKAVQYVTFFYVSESKIK